MLLAHSFTAAVLAAGLVKGDFLCGVKSCTITSVLQEVYKAAYGGKLKEHEGERYRVRPTAVQQAVQQAGQGTVD